MADKKITELDAIDAVVGTDLLVVVDDPSGTPVNKKAQVHQVDVTTLGGFPGDTDLFLRGDGTFAEPGFPTVTLFEDDAVPTGTTALDVTDGVSGVTLGMRFRSDIAGAIRGIRFYKGATGSYGTYTGALWTNAGTSLASAAISPGVATGWQTVLFGTPIAIEAGVTYVASYHAPGGHYTRDSHWFTSSNIAFYTRPPLRGMTDGVDGANGVFTYGAHAFPTSTFEEGCYWVDVLFTESAGVIAHADRHEPGGVDPITALDATVLTTGTLPDARFPATLPAVSGANLTNLNASQLLAGTVPGARLPAYYDYTEGTAANPAADTIRLYAIDFNGYSFLEERDSAGRTIRPNRDTVAVGKVDEAGGITRGQVVRVSGASGSNRLLKKALATDRANTPGVGMAMETGALNSFIRVLTSGLLTGLDTSGIAEGARVFLSATTAGALTPTAPVAPNLIQRMGYVLRSHATQGEIAVIPATALSESGWEATHASMHAAAGRDPLTITTLAGFPGGSSTFLRGDGTFAAASGPRETFRGLHLRSHPDADLAASRVMLVHADEIVFDDGTRVATGLDRLVANLAASGAGGLDTGSEAASTWYEIHAIRKSSDGTLNLLLHRAKAFTLDQQQTTITTAGSLRRATAPTRTMIAQSVVPALSGAVPFVDLALNRDGAVVGRIWVTLEADASGSPSGTPLATSDKLDASAIADADQWLRFIFRTPATVTASTTYWLVLQADYTASDTVVIGWKVDGGGGYAAGGLKSFDSGAWVTVVSTDGTFRLYVTQNDASVTMPSGYDQRCKIGYCHNAASSNLKQFSAVDRYVDFHNNSGDTNQMNAVATVPTLIEVATGWMPPQACVLRLMFRHTSAGGTVWAVGVPDFNASAVVSRLGISAISSQMQHPSGFPTETQAYYMWADGTGNVQAWMLGYQW